MEKIYLILGSSTGNHPFALSTTNFTDLHSAKSKSDHHIQPNVAIEEDKKHSILEEGIIKPIGEAAEGKANKGTDEGKESNKKLNFGKKI
jgi:hypothetical protein